MWATMSAAPMHLLAVYSPGGPEAILRVMPDCVTLPPGDWPNLGSPRPTDARAG
jgi:hypothetical protein